MVSNILILVIVLVLWVGVLSFAEERSHSIENEIQSSFQTIPFSGTFGAEIIGLDLENIDDLQFQAVHEAMLKHKVIVVRNQSGLSVEGQREFSKRFGRLHVHLESSTHLPGYKDVNLVSNIKGAGGFYSGLHGYHVENFHSDLSWTMLPTKVTILKSEIRPDGCGDTLFSNTVAVYTGLTPELKARLSGLTGRYSYMKLRNTNITGSGAAALSAAEAEAAAQFAVHPLVITHPETGEKNLFANPSDTSSVVQFYSQDESDALLNTLFAEIEKPEYAYRHVYKDGDVVFWDNRAVQHRATGCPDTSPRRLVRTTVSNDDIPRENITVTESLGGADRGVNRISDQLYNTEVTINSI